MCGISGVFNKNNLEITKNVISKVNNVAKHRGPDAENYFYKNNFAFGHRRLSIIDLSSVSDQPFSMFGFTIVYNGEIFNYIEIRQELLEKGYQFKTESDTEVVLASYKEWGVECVDKFNGMWAFCIYDENQGKFFCSRDRFGIKPFYFIDNPQYFAFGSEVKQLLILLPEQKANKKVLAEFIVGNEDYHEETFFEEVSKL
jgi:asparagine synthase (glutamine-hydrolysing)